MRLGIDARRARGRPATAAAWDTRRLPPPHARVLLGGIETAERFGPRMRRWAPGGASGTPRRSRSWPTAPTGSGSRPEDSCRGPSRCWTSSTGRNTGRTAPGCCTGGGGPGEGLGGRGAPDAAGGGGGRGAGAPGDGSGRGVVGGEAGGVFGRGRLLRAAGRRVGLRRAVGPGAVDRERAGGGGVQAGDRPAEEADGGAAAAAAGEPEGDAGRRRDALRAESPQRTPGIGARTLPCALPRISFAPPAPTG